MALCGVYRAGRKAAEAQALATAKKAQLAAQAAAAQEKAKGSEKEIAERRERLHASPSDGGDGGGGSVKATVLSGRSDPKVESFCLMSYEDKPPPAGSEFSEEQQQQEQLLRQDKQVVAHFAHALAVVFGGTTGEAAFISKVSFALDRLFRSFGRSKPGRGALNYPEFAGALRHVASQHGMDQRYVEKDVLADLFMFCDDDSDGYVKDFELRDFLLTHRRARRQRLRQKSQVARRKQAPRFRGPPPRRGQQLPRARMGPKRRIKIAPGLGLNRGVRGGGVRGRRRRKPPPPQDAGLARGGERRWVQQRGAARRRARDKAASTNMAHVRCAPMARRLLAAQTLQGWARAFCRYDRSRARCMQWREFKQSVRAACRETFEGEDALLTTASSEEELRQLFAAVDSDSDGFIGTKEFKIFLVGCTSAFLAATEPGSVAAGRARGAASDGVDSDDGDTSSGAMPLLRRQRRGRGAGGHASGWMAPTAASLAMGTQDSSLPKGRDSLGDAKPLRRRSQGGSSGGHHGRVLLAPLVDVTASFLKPTRASRLGERTKHVYDGRDLRHKSSLMQQGGGGGLGAGGSGGCSSPGRVELPRRAASALEEREQQQRQRSARKGEDRSRRVSDTGRRQQQQQQQQPDRARRQIRDANAKKAATVAAARATVTPAAIEDDVVEEHEQVLPDKDVAAAAIDKQADTSGAAAMVALVGTVDDDDDGGDDDSIDGGGEQDGPDQVMLKLKSKEARRKQNAAKAAASLSETGGSTAADDGAAGPLDEAEDDGLSWGSSTGSGESLQPWEKKQKKARGPPLTGCVPRRHLQCHFPFEK
jgi:Ca2+-binding EF-hand superfamily protein